MRGAAFKKEKLRAERTNMPPTLRPHVGWEGDTASCSIRQGGVAGRQQKEPPGGHLKGDFGETQ